jgi:hypothetical protein
MGEAIRSDAAHPKLTLLRTTSIKTHMFGRVTINGANFSVPDPADLTVMFNLTEAVVYSASATSIVAIAPLGATTGLIMVRTPFGKATSTSNFTVVTTPPPVTSDYLPPHRTRLSHLERPCECKHQEGAELPKSQDGY